MPSHATDTTIQMSGPGMLGKNTPGAGRSDLLSPDGVRAFAGVYSQEQVNAAFVSLAGAYSNPAWITAIDVAKVTGLSTTLASKADLVGGLVPAHQLPSYVDDVIEVADFGALPGTGEAGKIYVTLATSKTYRWSGSAYVELTDATAVWGQISGLVTNQTDLMNHLSTNYSSSGHTHTFASIQSKPTSLAGYGINDALSLSGGTLTGDLLFTDASYDIGKSGATRPRDGFFSRDLNAGGAITATGAINANGNIVFAPSPSSSGEIQRNGASNNQGVTLRETSTGAAIAVNPNTVSIYATSGLKLWNNIGTVAGPLECGAVTASGLLSLRDSTTPTELNLHSTFTSATSREYLKVLANTGGAYQIGSAIGSAGGSNRAIQIGHWNAAGSFTSSFSVNTVANQVQIGTIVAGYNTAFSTGVYGVNLNNGTPNCTIWSGDGSAFGSSFSGYNVFMVGHDVGTLSGFGIASYPKFVYSNGSTLSIPQICVGNPSGFSGVDLALGTTGTPTDGEYTVTSGYGTNKAGASMWLMAGRSTGTGAGGSVFIGTSNTGSSGATRNTNLTLAQFNSTAITFSRDLLFPDATYDIGKSGATRPRDGWFSRDLTASGYVVGLSGISWTSSYSHARLSSAGIDNVQMYLNATAYHDFRYGIHTCSIIGLNEGSLANPTNACLTSGPSAGVLDIRGVGWPTSNSATTAQTLRLFNTYTSTTSFENLQFKANAGAAYQIGSAIGSAGGTTRGVEIGSWDSAGTFSGRFITSNTGVVTINSSGRTTFGVGGGTNIAYFTSNGSFMGLGFNRVGVYGVGLRCDNGYSVSICAHNNDEASAWGQVFTVQTLTNGSDVGGKITTRHSAATNLPASTEATDVDFQLARTVQFATGALTTQRAFRIQAPTYSFVGASTITTASTLSISGAPAAGTNATITNAYALNVEGGTSYFAGRVRIVGDDLRVGTASASDTLQIALVGDGSQHAFLNLRAHATLSAGQIGNYGVDYDYAADASRLYTHTGRGLTLGEMASRPQTYTHRLRLLSSNWIISPASVVEQRNGTNAQEFQLYTTYTSATSYERIEIKGKSGANFEIGPENGSAGGSLRGLTIGGYSAGSSTITPWLTFTNAGAATFSGMISTSNSGILLSEVIIRRSTAGGIIEIADNSENFNRLQLGGRTSAYPAIKRSSAAVALRLADDSADAALTCAGITASDSVTTNGLFSSDRYAVSANYRFRRANGTSGSPTQVTSGQAVGALSSFGYHDGGAFHSSAGAILYFVAAESFTASGHGTNLQFWTTPVTSTTSAKRVTIEASGELTLEAGSHIQTSGAGIKIGTATSQKLGFWNATPVAQPTTAVAAATVAGVGGVGVSTLDTFDGYTIGQVVRALRNTGILA